MNKPTTFLQWFIIANLILFITACVFWSAAPEYSMLHGVAKVATWVFGVLMTVPLFYVAVKRPSLAEIEARRNDPTASEAKIALDARVNAGKSAYFSTVFSLLGMSAFYTVIVAAFSASSDSASEDDVAAFAVFMTLYVLISFIATIIFIVQTVRRYKIAKDKVWIKRMWIVFAAQLVFLVAMITAAVVL
jgi:hypothetical protein